MSADSRLRLQAERLMATARYDRDMLVRVLIHHQRTENTGCACGWGELGRSFAAHVADVYEQTTQIDRKDSSG